RPRLHRRRGRRGARELRARRTVRGRAGAARARPLELAHGHQLCGWIPAVGAGAGARVVAPPPSTDEWRDIARVPNLCYHILSWPEKEQEGFTDEEFYATGVFDWEDLRLQ